MPSWKKVITSGSDASLNSLTVINGITGSLFGTASYATQALSASYAPDTTFPYTGSALITGSLGITGSLYSTNIIGTGSLFLQPNQSDVRFIEIYNTSPTDTHITASGGQIFIGDDVTYIKVDNYGSVKYIDIVADNGLTISASIIKVTGSLYQSGTFYPDQIDWLSSSIGYDTGSYILTTTFNGLTTYAGYGDIANALAPYMPPISSSVSASYATTASYALTSSNVQGGTTNYIPIWNTDTSLSSSTIYQSNGNIGIQTTFPSASLHVFGSGSSTGSLSFLTSNALGTGSFRVYDNGNISNPGNNSNLYNEAFGANALESLNPAVPGAGATTALGPFVLRRATQTRANTAIGYASMAYTTGSSVTGSIALGYFALAYQQTGSFNIGIGYQAMQGTSTVPWSGSYNVGIGSATLFSNKGGSNNVAIGASSLRNNTTGNFSTAVGHLSLFSNTAGDHNTAIGDEALYSTTSGSYNVALGIESARGNTLGNYNVALGKQALLYNITGSYNIALGYSAGRATSASIFANNTENSIFIGTYTKPLEDNQTNQTVIGHEAIGIGSNTVTLGNDFVVTTALKGNVGIKTITPNADLDVNGNTIITGSLTIATGSSLLTVIEGITLISTPTPALIISSSQSTALQVVGGNNDNNIALFKNLILDSIVATIGISGSIFSSGSITATQGFTGSLFGTASWAEKAISSSFATTSSYSLSSSYSDTSTSASYAETASYAPLYLPLTGGTINGNVTVNGTASIAFLNVQYESASVIYSSGSNIFGDATNDTQTLIGTVLVSGSQQITGSLGIEGVIRSVYPPDPQTGAITAEFLSYSPSAYGLTFRGYQTGVHSIQNQREANDAEVYALSLQPNGGNVTIGKITSNAKLDVSGSAIISGSLNVTDGITGSLFGTASYAVKAISASISDNTYIQDSPNQNVNYLIASKYLSAGYEQPTKLTKIYWNNDEDVLTLASGAGTVYGNLTGTASYAVSSSQALTASYYAGSVTSASYAATSSYASSFTIGNSFITSSTIASSTAGANALFTQATGSFTAAKYLYTVSSASNARTGEVLAVWNGTLVQYTDYSTLDIGTTSAVTASVSIVTAQAQFNMQTTNAGWKIKSQVTYL